MDVPVLIRLPELHGGICSTPSLTEPRLLWPGLPGMPESGWWGPDDYPFTPSEAAACLSDMRAMGEAALSGVPLQALAVRDVSPKAARSAEELAELEHFARTGDAEEHVADALSRDIARRAAQKALLWVWLMEERILEIRALTKSYAAGTTHLMDALGVEHEDDLVVRLASVDTNMDTTMEENIALLPSWRMVVENAALFLPEGAAIWANTPGMAADLRETLNFVLIPTEYEASLPVGAADVRHAVAPLWKALGKSAPRPGCPWQKTTLHFLLREEN